jgi:hypothetical protein
MAKQDARHASINKTVRAQKIDAGANVSQGVSFAILLAPTENKDFRVLKIVSQNRG